MANPGLKYGLIFIIIFVIAAYYIAKPQGEKAGSEWKTKKCQEEFEKAGIVFDHIPGTLDPIKPFLSTLGHLNDACRMHYIKTIPADKKKEFLEKMEAVQDDIDEWFYDMPGDHFLSDKKLQAVQALKQSYARLR